jgi:hypothetical protein
MDVLDVGWGFDSLDWMKRDDPIAEIACQYVAPTMKKFGPADGAENSSDVSQLSSFTF